ncbi:hypothetical protein XENTR_v10004967 [Xenopus tropicalis]|nr:hypothetical protein XENTR_v10004967 [Xenopus tropicalis]
MIYCCFVILYIFYNTFLYKYILTQIFLFQCCVGKVIYLGNIEWTRFLIYHHALSSLNSHSFLSSIC